MFKKIIKLPIPKTKINKLVHANRMLRYTMENDKGNGNLDYMIKNQKIMVEQAIWALMDKRTKI